MCRRIFVNVRRNQYLSKCVQEILRFYQSAFIQTDREGNENGRISAFLGKDTENLRRSGLEEHYRPIKFNVSLWASEIVIKDLLKRAWRLISQICIFLGSISVPRGIGNFFGTCVRQVVLLEFAGALHIRPFIITPLRCDDWTQTQAFGQLATKYTPATYQLVLTCRSRDFLVAKAR
jgi:hypothetical protein